MRRALAGRLVASLLVAVACAVWTGSSAAAAPSRHIHVNCLESSICAEIANYREVFGNYYVGHDEPVTIFNSDKPGSGNRARYTLTLPKDPSPSNPTLRASRMTSSWAAPCGSACRCAIRSLTPSR